MSKVASFEKLKLGFSLLLLGLILLFGKPAADSEVSYTFSQEPVTVVGFEDNDEDSSSAKQIVIPKVGVDIAVEKARIIDGYWEVFPDKAGWGAGSGRPGETGNQVIFAHAREGLFLPLKEVAEGDIVYVLTDSGWFGYQINEIKEVYPNQVEVIAQTDDERLTLYTCSGYLDEKRLVIVAYPVAE